MVTAPTLNPNVTEERVRSGGLPYRCCGCGAISETGIKPCDCPTGLGYRLDAKGSPNDIVGFMTAKARDAAELAHLIRTRLLGVDPDDQDLELEDHDWQLIIDVLEYSL